MPATPGPRSQGACSRAQLYPRNTYLHKQVICRRMRGGHRDPSREGASMEEEVGMAEVQMTEVATPSAGTWKIDPTHATAGFVARHLMVTKVRGRFTEVEGEVRIGETPEDSSIEVRMAAASIESGNPDRDTHL